MTSRARSFSPLAGAILALAAFVQAPFASQAQPAARSGSPAATSATQTLNEILPTSATQPGGRRGGRGGRGGGGGRGGFSAEVIQGAMDDLKIADVPGPVEANWDSLKANYKAPAWLIEGKFCLCMHWGIYSVPARQSEWYVRYIYGGNQGIMNDHIAKYGPLDKFGYKDFIPMFTAAKWDPDAWAKLFKDSGAVSIAPTAEHHDGFSLWDSAYNKYNAVKMGPHRDLIGDMAAAVRKQGLKFGITNHSMEHFTFIGDPQGVPNDLRDPEWADFYSVADRSPAAARKFLTLWVEKNVELIDKYQVDLLWFDNGLNGRNLDPLKLAVAKYYYNRAAQWGKQVTISTKGAPGNGAYLAGSMHDYERTGRILPREIKDFPWEVDEPIGSKFGYVNEIQYKSAELLIHRLIDTVSMNGVFMLNLSPLADGTIPQPQQDRLLEIGKWLAVNGEAIRGTRAWHRYGEGPFYDAPPAAALDDAPGEHYGADEIRFTTKDGVLYAIVTGWPENGEVVIKSLAKGAPNADGIAEVSMLGNDGKLAFVQDAEGLKVKFPATKPCDYAFSLKIIGAR